MKIEEVSQVVTESLQNFEVAFTVVKPDGGLAAQAITLKLDPRDVAIALGYCLDDHGLMAADYLAGKYNSQFKKKVNAAMKILGPKGYER